MEIGPATAADLPRLVELLGILFAQEAEFRPDPERQLRGLKAILGDPASGTILVARAGGSVAGMVVILDTVSTYLGGRVAWLEDMVVDPAHRGTGLGASLLDAAIRHARAAGCLRMTLLTDADNEAAHRFYRRQGFRPSPMTPFRLTLETREPPPPADHGPHSR